MARSLQIHLAERETPTPRWSVLDTGIKRSAGPLRWVAASPRCLIWQVIGGDGSELSELYRKLRDGDPLRELQAAL